MTQRFVVAALACATLLACTTVPSAVPLTDSADKSASASGDGDDSPTTPTTTTTTTSIDGTWDVLTLGGSVLSPSQVTISGNHITADLAIDRDGVSDEDGCPITEQHYVLSMTLAGDTLDGTLNLTNLRSGNDDACSNAVGGGDWNFEAKRTHAAGNAEGATAFEGSWVFSYPPSATQTEMPTYAITVTGLAAKMWDRTSASQSTGGPWMTANIANNAAGTSSNDSDLQFAARKR